MDIINNVIIIWNGELRNFENVTEVERGRGFVAFTDGKIRRFFSDVPYEVESYYPGDKTDELPDDVIQWQKGAKHLLDSFLQYVKYISKNYQIPSHKRFGIFCINT